MALLCIFMEEERQQGGLMICGNLTVSDDSGNA